MWLLLAFVVASTAWQLFPDGPLAFYITQGLLITMLCIQLARKSPLWPVYLYGALMAFMTSACGGMYAGHADGYHFLCDKGTGIPLSSISLGFALLIALCLWRRDV